MRIATRLTQWFRQRPPKTPRQTLLANNSTLSFGCVDGLSAAASRAASPVSARSYPDHPGVRSGSRCTSRDAGSPLLPALARFPTPPPPVVRQSFYSALSDMQGNLAFAPALQLTVY